MTNIIWLNGRHEHIESPEAFAQIINERLGSEAADLLREYLDGGNSIKGQIGEAVSILCDLNLEDDNDCNDLEYAIEILRDLITELNSRGGMYA